MSSKPISPFPEKRHQEAIAHLIADLDRREEDARLESLGIRPVLRGDERCLHLFNHAESSMGLVPPGTDGSRLTNMQTLRVLAETLGKTKARDTDSPGIDTPAGSSQDVSSASSPSEESTAVSPTPRSTARSPDVAARRRTMPANRGSMLVSECFQLPGSASPKTVSHLDPVPEEGEETCGEEKDIPPGMSSAVDNEHRCSSSTAASSASASADTKLEATTNVDYSQYLLPATAYVPPSRSGTSMAKTGNTDTCGKVKTETTDVGGSTTTESNPTGLEDGTNRSASDTNSSKDKTAAASPKPGAEPTTTPTTTKPKPRWLDPSGLKVLATEETLLRRVPGLRGGDILERKRVVSEGRLNAALPASINVCGDEIPGYPRVARRGVSEARDQHEQEPQYTKQEWAERLHKAGVRSDPPNVLFPGIPREMAEIAASAHANGLASVPSEIGAGVARKSATSSRREAAKEPPAATFTFRCLSAVAPISAPTSAPTSAPSSSTATARPISVAYQAPTPATMSAASSLLQSQSPTAPSLTSLSGYAAVTQGTKTFYLVPEPHIFALANMHAVERERDRMQDGMQAAEVALERLSQAMQELGESKERLRANLKKQIAELANTKNELYVALMKARLERKVMEVWNVRLVGRESARKKMRTGKVGGGAEGKNEDMADDLVVGDEEFKLIEKVLGREKASLLLAKELDED